MKRPALITAMLLLSGCSSESILKSQAALNENNAVLAAAAARATSTSPQTGRITQSQELFLGNEVIELGRGSALPETTGSINFWAREPLPLSTVARALSAQAGYPILALFDDAPRVTGHFQGDLASIFSQLKTEFSVGYEHRDGTILLLPADTEIVPIPIVVMPSLPASGGLAQSNRSRTASSAAQGQNLKDPDLLTSTQGLKSFLADLPKMINDGPYAAVGARVTVHEKLSIISIKAPPAAMSGIKSLLEDRIAKLLTPIQATLRILTLDVGDSRNFSTNLDYIWDKLFGTVARFSGNSTNSTLSLLRSKPSLKANTIDGAVQTIATRLDVLNNQRFTVRLVPGYPMPISDTRIITYVRESTPPGQISSSVIASTTSTITQDEVEVGTKGTLVAYPTSKSTIRLNYTFDLSQLLDLKTLTSGNVTVQQPDTAPRTFSSIVDLRSGDTIIADARLIEHHRKSNAGAFSPDLPFPGYLNSENRLQLVLVLVSGELIAPTAPVRDPSLGNVLRVAEGSL